jgi:hypothetical protein
MPRRHEVIDHGWDELKQCGWMLFKCLACGYEYKKWMKQTRTWQYTTPKRPGEKVKRTLKPYSRFQLQFLAKYWRVGNGGTSVTSCKGCLPKQRLKIRKVR